LVSFYAAREDSDRLHKEKVYEPLNEGRRKDLTEFKSHVMSSTDIKTLTYGRGFTGVKL